MIRADFHVHTTYCDGKGTPEEMVRAAIAMGLDAVGFSGHSRTAFDESWCMSEAGTAAYRAEIARLKAAYAGRIAVYCGIEQDYLSALPAEGYDYVIGSVHWLDADGVYIPVDESAADLRRAAPVLDLCLNIRIAAFHHTGDDRVTLSGPFQVGHHFAHSPAGVEFAQPGGGVSVGVIGGFLFLYVHQHHGHIQIPDSGEHVVAGSVGEQLQDHQIHVRRPELVPSFHSLFLGGHDAAIHQFHGIGDQLFEILILALKLRHQGRELGQVRA